MTSDDTLLGMLATILRGAGVTFVLSGGVVTGEIIGPAEYLRTFAGNVRAGMTAGGDAMAPASPQPLMPVEIDDEAHVQSAGDGVFTVPRRLYLRNARVVSAAGTVPAASGTGLLMCVDTAEIAAWTLGSLRAA